MRKLGELQEYWSPGLTLTILGREYTLPLPSAELGLWCRGVSEIAGHVDSASTDEEMQAAVAAVEELPELPGGTSLPERMLGDVHEQMIADEVPYPYIVFASQTAYLWVTGGEEAAERFWTSGGRPERRGPAENRASRRAEAKKGTGRTGTAAAKGTQSRVSTSGTKSPKKNARSGAAKRTTGAKS